MLYLLYRSEVFLKDFDSKLKGNHKTPPKYHCPSIFSGFLASLMFSHSLEWLEDDYNRIKQRLLPFLFKFAMKRPGNSVRFI